MTNLCTFCAALDLRYVGYHGPTHGARRDDFTSATREERHDDHGYAYPDSGHADGDGDNHDDDDDDDDNNDDDVDDDIRVAHEQDNDSSTGRGGPLGDGVKMTGPAEIPENPELDPSAENDRYEYDAAESEYEDVDVDRDRDPYTFVHTVPEMLAASATCRFCGELARLFHRWVDDAYPGRGGIAGLSLADSEVKISRGLATAPEPDNGARLMTARVTILMRDPVRPELDNHFYWAGMTLAYQQVRWEAWPRLRDMLDSMDACEAEGQSPLAVWSEHAPYYSARQRRGRVDLRLLRRWKETCFAWHGDRCRSAHTREKKKKSASGDGDGDGDGKSDPQEMLRLVDVDNMCIVEIADRSTVAWAVLSYVWGRAPFFTLTTENRLALMQPGSLAIDGLLPDTVADAIAATRGLGERYLWTDSLCIVQDSAEDVSHYVPDMELIYGSAVVAIVDLGGDSASHGLPGVSTDRFAAGRNSCPAAPEPLIINDTRIVRAPQPTGTGYEDMDDQRCVYLQRGWTFQEALLSSRFVLFSADTVFWECPCATWREDANWEVEGGKEEEEELPAILRNPFLAVQSAVQYDRLWRPTAEDFDASYQALAHAFSRRKLSYEGDGLAAFSGILHALEKTTKLEATGTEIEAKRPPLEFIWGLPGPFLGMALTWPADREEITTLDDDGLPVTDAPPFFYRRTEKCLVVVPRDDGSSNSSSSSSNSTDKNTADAGLTTAKVPFPSWSWIGWVGPVLYDELFGSLLSEHAGIRFYVFSSGGGGQLVEVPQHTAFQDRWPANPSHVRAPPLWRETSSSGNVVDAGAVPESIRADPALRHIVLAFWTSCCPRLHVMYEPRTLVDDRIVGTADVWEEKSGSHAPSPPPPLIKFSADWVQRPPRSWRAGLHVVECIVVGRDNLGNMSSDSRLVLLVTERVGEDEKELAGMRRRVAAMTVDEKEWNELQTRRWEVVVLV